MEKDVIKLLLDWLGGNWGWVIIIFCTFFEIAPIKIHPISATLGWIGKKLTGSLKQDIADLRRDVDEQRMSAIRSLVLDFSNSCLNKRKHTKEEFDHVLEENKTYEKLVEKYEVDNDVYAEAIAYIKRIYRKRMDRCDFLTTPQADVDDMEE